MPKPISKADLLSALKDLASDLGRPPTRAEMESQGEYSATPYYRQFGSWTEALKAADIDPQYRQQIPEKELRTAVHDLAEELGHTPRAHEMAEEGRFSPSTYRRRFGSWRKALKWADLSLNNQPSSSISRAELVSALRDLASELGRPPTQTDMDTQGPYSADIYHNRFGSWNTALSEAGLKLD